MTGAIIAATARVGHVHVIALLATAGAFLQIYLTCLWLYVYVYWTRYCIHVFHSPALAHLTADPTWRLQSLYYRQVWRRWYAAECWHFPASVCINFSNVLDCSVLFCFWTKRCNFSDMCIHISSGVWGAFEFDVHPTATEQTCVIKLLHVPHAGLAKVIGRLAMGPMSRRGVYRSLLGMVSDVFVFSVNVCQVPHERSYLMRYKIIASHEMFTKTCTGTPAGPKGRF